MAEEEAEREIEKEQQRGVVQAVFFLLFDFNVTIHYLVLKGGGRGGWKGRMETTTERGRCCFCCSCSSHCFLRPFFRVLFFLVMMMMMKNRCSCCCCDDDDDEDVSESNCVRGVVVEFADRSNSEKEEERSELVGTRKGRSGETKRKDDDGE